MSKWDEVERELKEARERGSEANREIRGWWASRSEKQRRVIRVALAAVALAVIVLVAR